MTQKKARKGLFARLRFWLGTLVVLLVALVVAGYAVLSSYDFEDLRGEIERQAEAATGRKLTISGPIDLKISLTPAVTLEGVTFANAAWGSRPEMATVKRFELEVALLPLLTGELRTSRLVLVEPDILLETGPNGLGNWVLDRSEAAKSADTTPAEGGTTLPSFDHVTLRGGRLVFRGAGETHSLEVGHLDLSAANATSPVALSLGGRYNGVGFEASGTLGSLGRISLGAEPFPLALIVRSGSSEVSLQGEVMRPQEGDGLRFEVSGKGDSLAEFSAFAGSELPPLGPWSLNAKLTQDGTLYRLSGLAGDLGESDFAGTASVDLGKDRPIVTAALTSNRLRFQDLATDDDRPPSDGRLFSDAPLPFGVLKAFDAEMKLSAASVEPQGKLKLENVDLLLSLKGGKLKVAPLTALLADGGVTASLEVDATAAPAKVAFVASGADIDYGRLLHELEIEDTAEGKVDIEIALAGSGNSLHAIASSLNGKTDLVGGAGKLDNTLLSLVSVDLLGLIEPLTGGDGTMDLACVVSRFAIEEGIATSTAQLIHAENVSLQGGGTIDLGEERIDMIFEPKASVPSLASLAVPFRIQGPLNDPGVLPDPLGTALTAAKTAGSIIMPLAGLGILLGDAVLASGNPCTAALEAGATGEQEPQKSTLEKATEGVGETLESIGEGIKGLFGN